MANVNEKVNLELCLSFINFKLNLSGTIWLVGGVLDSTIQENMLTF
jgi:hypothetical protein